MKWSISILAMGNYVFSHAQYACWAPRLTDFLILITHASTASNEIKLRCYQLRLVARAVASHRTMQSFLIGYVHSVSLYSGDAIVPCLAPTYLHNMEVRYRKSCKTSLGINASTENTSVYLKANPLPLRKTLWPCALTQYERYVGLHDYEDLRFLIYSECMPPSMHNKAATSIPLLKDVVINELRCVSNIIGMPHNHNRAPLTQHRIIPWNTVSCNKVRFYQPLFVQGV
ncbi:mucin TcMUCII [Trypanosoma cruzi]|nr:mucin TcMUCII [Trypanosoma cruzi]